MALTTKSKGTSLALAGTLLFGLNASTTKVVMAVGITPAQMVGFRSLCSALIAGLVLLATNRGAFRVEKREWPGLIGFGVVGVALMQWAYSYSVQLLPVGIALLFEYTAIVWVPLASYVLFKQTFKPRLWFGVAAVLIGLAIVAEVWHSSLNPMGVVAGIAAALFTSTYFIMGQRTQRSRDAFSTLFYTMLISTVFWSAISPWWPPIIEKYATSVDLGGSLTGVTPPLWVMLAWIGILGSFAPMLLSYKAMRLLPPTIMGIISTSEVLYAFAFGLLWLGEKISGLQLLGGLLVLAGIVFAETSRGKTWQPSN
ncbi:MAG: hypothetical protein RL016_524 [Actinomycetota bacterium]|jgi:drug/metabolite transporter (DMT)-like permease